MRFEGEFRVPGSPADVLNRFADVERMVVCMPGASIEGRDEEGNYLGAMLVAFGFKKIRFRGKVTCRVDPATHTGSMHVRGAADMRSAARVEVRVVYALREDSAAPHPTSIVALTSEAEMGGVLADFARTGGVAVTNALMEQFAQRVAEEFGREATVDAPADIPISASQPSIPSPAALPAHSLLWSVVKTKLRALAARWRARAIARPPR